jgi:predicted ATPase/DNA-binding SARP family transcriptional activator
MRFGILGPFEVTDDQGREVRRLGGRKQRAVLAILLLRAGEVVSSDRLIDELWGDRAPATAAKTLQVYVSNLRKALGEGVLVTRAGGYVLQVDQGGFDLQRFQVLVGEGVGAAQAGDPRRAGELLREALGLWRGPALADFAYQQFAQHEIVRLEAARLVALEERIDADLELGAGAALIAELDALVAANPLHERLLGQLMRALYRAGRQTDALAVYRALGERLREELGLEPGQSLQQLELAILQQDPSLDPKPAVTSGSPSTLPVPTTPLVGRVRELAEIAALLRSADTRILTLTGAGGNGKTRLALAVAEQALTEYRDGAWFVALAEVADADLLASTIAQALGLAEQPDWTPEQSLGAWLQERELLLLLDNMEQLTEGADLLATLVSACPTVTFLVTSREPLYLSAERQYEVPALESEEAVALFSSRAEAVAPRVSVDPAQADAICERLDRLPLAIELAAARIKALTPDEILTRLDRSLALLTGGPRDAPRRQRTIRGTIDWSYELLSGEERGLFARLAVFSGGCTLAAAEAVARAEVEVLRSLIDRSLVRRDGGRYRMLQTLREYALERLNEAGDEHDLRQAHASWLIGLLERERLPQPGWPNERSLMRVAPERENLRSALEWALRSDRFETIAQLAAPAVGVWVMSGQLQEATRWMTIALEHEDDYPERLAAQVVSAARALAWHRGEFETMATLAQRALARWRKLGDLEAIGTEIVSSGLAACEAGDAARGRAAFQEGLQFARGKGLSDIVAIASTNLADLAIHEGRLDEGRSLSEECCAASGHESVIASAALINLAHIAILEGSPTAAAGFAREALRPALRRGDLLTVACAGIELAWPLAQLGDLERAAQLLGSAVEFLTRAGARREWMDRNCEAAVYQILRDSLDTDTAQGLLDRGRGASLHAVARDALDSPVLTAEVTDGQPARPNCPRHAR